MKTITATTRISTKTATLYINAYNMKTDSSEANIEIPRAWEKMPYEYNDILALKWQNLLPFSDTRINPQ